MSPVTPKPAAAVSTLAMTKSRDSRSTSAGIARRAMSRPGLPKMSPTKRMRMRAGSGDRDADLSAAPLGEPRHHDAQFAVFQRRHGLAGVERPVHADSAR